MVTRERCFAYFALLGKYPTMHEAFLLVFCGDNPWKYEMRQRDLTWSMKYPEISLEDVRAFAESEETWIDQLENDRMAVDAEYLKTRNLKGTGSAMFYQNEAKFLWEQHWTNTYPTIRMDFEQEIRELNFEDTPIVAEFKLYWNEFMEGILKKSKKQKRIPKM